MFFFVFFSIFLVSLEFFLYLCIVNKSYLYQQLYLWWESHKRELPWRETTDPYAIWLSEIILQQTRVAQGIDYYRRFMERFPTVRHLAAADEQEVMRLWQGLGYYSRARNLHKAAQMVAEQQTKQHPFPATWDELRTLPGVGDYTAGAIASFAYDQPYPALDGNVYRVLSRLYDCDIPFDTTPGKRHFRQLAEQLLDRDHPRLFNSAIMELGALHCLPAGSDCASCPLAEVCLAYAHHTVELLPIRKPRPKVTERKIQYIIYITPERRTLIHRRSGKDIWQGLWEFYLLPETESEAAAGTEPIRKSVSLTHILSHRKILATFHLCPVDTLPAIEGMKEIDWQDLDDYGMSRLTLLALEKLELL